MNNVLVTLNDNDVPTTTSIQVADHFDKQHGHVIRDIEVIINTLKSQGISPSNFGESEWVNERGRTYPMYTMNRDGFMLLVMGFTGDTAIVFKNDFIVAFNEMEAELRKPKEQFEIPTTFPEALRLALKQAEQLEIQGETLVEQEAVLTEQAPKVEAFDTYLDTDGSMSITEAAKCICMTGHRLGRMLRDDGVLWKQHVHKKAPNLPRAGYEKYFEAVRVTPKGQNTSWPQTRVTPLGLEWLRQNYV
jgi:anti-repressor protein